MGWVLGHYLRDIPITTTTPTTTSITTTTTTTITTTIATITTIMTIITRDSVSVDLPVTAGREALCSRSATKVLPR